MSSRSKPVATPPAGRRTLASLLLPAALLLLFPSLAHAQDPGQFRVCADPDNLPFASEDRTRQGLYVELAAALAQSMRRELTIHWWRNIYGKRMLRNTLLADKCDAYFGLPHGAELFGPRIIYSKPFLEVAYALVVPKAMTVARLADLRGKKIGVQFGSPPQFLLANLDDFQTATFLSAEEAMAALAQGQIDAAFIWGPSAGYYNKEQLGARFAVLPTNGRGMHWSVAVGFARNDAALRDLVDTHLARLDAAIADLKRKYGLPDGPAFDLTAAPEPAAGKEAAAGRVLFNNNCAHCHGPNGVAAEKRVDLRRMRLKYGAEAEHAYVKATRDGRTAKGMPAWKDTLSETELAAIKAFVDTLQRQ